MIHRIVLMKTTLHLLKLGLLFVLIKHILVSIYAITPYHLITQYTIRRIWKKLGQKYSQMDFVLDFLDFVL